MKLWELLSVGCGGFVGAILRHVIGLTIQRRAGEGFPWGTLSVNLLGCLLIGVLMGLVESRRFTSEAWRLALITGLLGSLTTFSTFSHDTLGLIRKESLGLALANGMGSLIAGLLCAALGRWLVEG